MSAGGSARGEAAETREAGRDRSPSGRGGRDQREADVAREGKGAARPPAGGARARDPRAPGGHRPTGTTADSAGGEDATKGERT